MYDDLNNVNKYQFVQHNVFFLSWLLATKKDIHIHRVKNTDAYIINGISNTTYIEYKKEYKKHKSLLKEIKNNVKNVINM